MVMSSDASAEIVRLRDRGYPPGRRQAIQSIQSLLTQV